MGFSYFNYGGICPCSLKDGVLTQYLPSGFEVSYNTTIDKAVNIPKQTNYFVSKNVMFLLYDDNKMYIGRKDKSISIYDVNDNELLVGLATWETPRVAETMIVGLYRNHSNLTEIHLDLRDNQSLYLKGLPITSKFLKPVKDYNFNMDTAVLSAEVYRSGRHYCICYQGGESVDEDVWVIQTELRNGDYKVFL